jgi:6-pyruvoyltetrahydropterin/6-carboxytetrahydropterin synthase
MYEVTVEGAFCASHQLRLAGGELEPLHGHNWEIEARFEGEQLDGQGLLVDFLDVQAALTRISGQLHHHHLNDLPFFQTVNPSAENVAKLIFDELEVAGDFGRSLTSVRVLEAPGCVAGYSRSR